MGEVHYTDRQQRSILRVVPELIHSRELLLGLIWKDQRVRYRYAAMGYFWAVLEPLLMTAILTFVFSLLAGQRAEVFGVPKRLFPVMVLAGYILWQFFLNSVSSAARSAVDNRTLISKVYFTREVVPLAAVGNSAINLAIGLVLLVLTGLVFGLGPKLDARILYAPLVLAVLLLLVVGPALLLSCLNASFRDVSYITDVALLMGFYGSPVLYQFEFVQHQLSPRLANLYLLNPMAGVITAFRASLGLTDPAAHLHPGELLLWPCALGLVLLAAGIIVFRRHAPLLSDNL